jgi:hypothetical protein
MRSKFRLELDVVVDDEAVPAVIEAARLHYSSGSAVPTEDEPASAMALSPDKFIRRIEDALMELCEPANANVEVERVACKSVAAPAPALIELAKSESPQTEARGRQDDSLNADETDEDLEEFETGIYLCRWPNGEFSLVKADDRKSALVQLDEWAGAEPAWLIPVETCMIDFRLNDSGEIELAEFGDETEEFIWEQCYPELNEVLGNEDASKHVSEKCKERAAERIRRAVEHERTRLWHKQMPGKPARTALGRELQKRLGTVGPVADSYVEVAGKEILKSKKGENGKPN